MLDVVERIRFQDNEIGEVAGFEGADLRTDVTAESLRGVRGGALKDLHRRKAGLLHQLKFTKDRGAVDRSDVPGVGAGGDGDTGILERLEIFQRDVVGLLDAVEDQLRIIHRGLDATGHFVGRQFRDVE